MRTAEGIVALFGPSFVGKTAVAEVVASQLGRGVRKCGDIFKERATALGVAVEALPLEEHRRIDEETRAACSVGGSPLVVEGRYLDAVLALHPNVVIVRLVCSLQERARRLARRSSITVAAAAEELQGRDREDERMRALLFGLSIAMAETSTLDTSSSTIDQVADDVLQAVRRP